MPEDARSILRPIPLPRAEIGSQGRGLELKDALGYLHFVKTHFRDKPEVYEHFLRTIREFTQKRIDASDAVQRLCTLFQGNPLLTLGLNNFLPAGFRVECTGGIFTITTPVGIAATDNDHGASLPSRRKRSMEEGDDNFSKRMKHQHTSINNASSSHLASVEATSSLSQGLSQTRSVVQHRLPQRQIRSKSVSLAPLHGPSPLGCSDELDFFNRVLGSFDFGEIFARLCQTCSQIISDPNAKGSYCSMLCEGVAMIMARVRNTVSAVSAAEADEVKDNLQLSLVQQDHAPAILDLRGGASQFALDIIYELLGSAGTLNYDARIASVIRDRLRRMLMKLSLMTNQLPCFADIYRGMFGEQPIALKVLRVYEMMEDSKKTEVKNAFYHEALLWRTMDHPHILPFLGIDNTIFRHGLSMVLPWVEPGNIRHVLDSRKNTGQSVYVLYESVHRYLSEIASGMEYLHGEKIVHGDLRGANILVDTSGAVRLTDFGLAVFADGTSNHYASTRGGAARWLAPELIDGDIFNTKSSRPTFASDIYAFGCVCIELYTFKAPFAGHLSDHQVLTRVPTGVRPQRPLFDGVIHMPDALWSLVSACWSHSPTSRLTIERVIEQISAIS